MHMMALRYGDDIVVIDAGMMFPEAELLGVDIVTPDLTFLKEHRQHVRALLLTHGHEDHIGAVAFFLEEFRVPVYGTAFTLSLVEPRLEDVFNRSESRLFVSCFSSSIHRLQQIIDISEEFGRKVALVGRSMIAVTEIAHNHGFLTIPDNILMRPQDIMGAKPSKVTV